MNDALERPRPEPEPLLPGMKLCPDCRKPTVVEVDGADVCQRCFAVWLPEPPPSEPSAAELFALFPPRGDPSPLAIRDELGIGLWHFWQLVHRYLRDGEADAVAPELADRLRRRSARRNALRRGAA